MVEQLIITCLFSNLSFKNRMNLSAVRQVEEQRVTGIGRFYTRMSKCFILPFYINNNMTVLKFNLFSLRTSLSFAISCIPLTFAVIWTVLRDGFLSDYISAIMRVYIKVLSFQSESVLKFYFKV